MKSLYRRILIVFGWIFVGLGIIGIFLPLMPTTVFFILAAASFARSSEKFYNWLINHPRFGKIVKSYMEQRGIPRKSKIIAITMVILTIGSSAVFFTSSLTLRIILAIIAFGVIAYLLSLKTVDVAESD
ncbi:hypothetical protein MROS_0840 [Melioribacter roseus P3M-2]|uniref:Inner membrane protein YbaN n=1 Tax=Melioribacter roseus (strain DSM 23840 / JCM 17771 / VKM B-2668 / P3M-2) TaxID=1191523 RepID=I7A2D0_MELRP|nr:YbaN family protein [Melioribacter roseus]AFN74081.1 hypothetical protein MROS_0840 [Melioribacter roseus P3M-2]